MLCNTAYSVDSKRGAARNMYVKGISVNLKAMLNNMFSGVIMRMGALAPLAFTECACCMAGGLPSHFQTNTL